MTRHTSPLPARSSRRELRRRPIGECLCDVLGANVDRPCERGDRTRHPRDARTAAARQRQPVDRTRQQLCSVCRQLRAGGPQRADDWRQRVLGRLPKVRPGRPRARSTAVAAARRRGRIGRAGLARDGRGSDRVAGDCTSTIALPSPRPPHGHMFIVPTSWNLAGKTQRPPTLAIAIAPSSSGCRRASSTSRGNSGSSSSRSTPRWASVASPGRGVEPPPTMAAAEAV